MVLSFKVSHHRSGDGHVTLGNPRVVLAGYTGRNQEQVMAHIQELLNEGVPAPESTPTYYFPPDQLLMFPATDIPVASANTSGEIEPVLIIEGGQRWISLGSDHTDRVEEQRSVDFAKTLGPKVVADEVWPWAEVSDHWDQLQLIAFVDGAPYQKGTTASLLRPDDHPLPTWESDSRPTLLFLGTVPTLEGVSFGRTFRGELHDPILNRTLSLEYSVKEVRRG